MNLAEIKKLTKKRTKSELVDEMLRLQIQNSSFEACLIYLMQSEGRKQLTIAAQAFQQMEGTYVRFEPGKGELIARLETKDV